MAIKRSLRNGVEQIWENSARIFLLITVIFFFPKEKTSHSLQGGFSRSEKMAKSYDAAVPSQKFYKVYNIPNPRRGVRGKKMDALMEEVLAEEIIRPDKPPTTVLEVVREVVADLAAGHPKPGGRLYPVSDSVFSINGILEQIDQKTEAGKRAISTLLTRAAAYVITGNIHDSRFQSREMRNFYGVEKNLLEFYEGRFNPFGP